jgi:hypothetical protein
MKHMSLGFVIGVVLALLHLCLAVSSFLAMRQSHSSTAGLAFLPFFFLDAPLFLLPSSALRIFGMAAPLIQFGVLGSAMWFLIPWLIDKAVTRLFPNGNRAVRAIIIVATIPLLLFGFTRLSFFSVKLAIQRERPAELKSVLNQASSAFLTEKVVFQDSEPGYISGITRMNCRPGAGTELLLSLPRGIAFLNDNYREQHRLNLSEQRFHTIQPLAADDTHSCRFLAYKFQEGVHLFDLEGKEIWKIIRLDNRELPIAGVQFGDVDGDGRPEFAISRSYTQPIQLIDDGGKTRWKHPVLALGHLEIADVSGDGKAQVIYTNANNAGGTTDFTFLDANGAVAKKLTIRTKSFDFAMIRWPPRGSKLNILLTEDGKIKIIDLKGDTVKQLDAPGCRTFGGVNAVTVKFRKGEPEYLAVSKRLHPDLSVLYVYDADGKLVYQKTEVVQSTLASPLAAVPASEVGTEKLLVGSARDCKALVVEYSLTQ